MLGHPTSTKTRTTLLGLALIFFSVALAVPSRLVAKEVLIKNGKLEIGFLADEKFVPKAFRKRLNEDWDKFCQNFGALFLNGKGPQGRGVFSEANCSALDFTDNTQDLQEVENSWNFIFSWDKDNFSVSIAFRGKSAKAEGSTHIVSRIDFPRQFTPDFLFTYPEALYYVANRIYRRLPFAWNVSLTQDDIQWQLPTLTDQMLGIVAPARRLGIFGLVYDIDRKTWMPILYGTAQPIGIEDSGKRGKDKEDASGAAAYEITWNPLAPRQKMIKLWAQELYPPTEKEIDPTFITVRMKEEDPGILEEYAIEGLHANSIYMRYGIPFPKGNTVVSQSPKMEFNVLFGKGILDGLNLNFDYSPRITDNVDGESYSYTWSRWNIGWSFMLGKPQTINRYATRFKLTPRMGLLNLDAYFPLNAEEDLDFATTAEFRLSNQLDFGGEFSWELESLTYRLKLWGTSNLSGYVFAGSEPTKVSSQRAGADFVYDVYRSKGTFHLGLMAFGYIDWVSLQKETEPEFSGTSLLASSTTASGAAYNVTFLGLGLVFVW